jgi:hypothetical protein
VTLGDSSGKTRCLSRKLLNKFHGFIQRSPADAEVFAKVVGSILDCQVRANHENMSMSRVLLSFTHMGRVQPEFQCGGDSQKSRLLASDLAGFSDEMHTIVLL